MSLQGAIQTHLDNELWILPPLLVRLPRVRAMIVSKDIFHAADPQSWSGGREGERLGRFRRELDRFTVGDQIAVALFPKKKPPTTYLARLNPVANEVWDIRSVDPKPGIRALGRFATQDVFVALVWDFHENVKGHYQWAQFGQRCLNEWSRLFPNLNPHHGVKVNDYVSSNYLAV